jgi:predicted PurR-regulated permease PerM
MPSRGPASPTVSGAPLAPPPGRDRWGRQLAFARNQLFAFFFFAVFLFLLYQLYRILSPFLGPILWAAILALLFYPLYQRVLRRVHGNATLAALALTALVTAAIVLPTVSLSSVVTRESAGLYEQLTDFVRSGRLNQTVQGMRDSGPGRLVQRLSRAGWEIDYAALVQRAADATSSQVTTFARNVAVFVLDFTIMIFTLFFFFRDGESMVRGLRDLIPMSAEDKDAIFYRLYDTLSAVMRGMLVTAIAQGILMWLGLAILQFPYAAFLGVLTAVASFIPLVGAAGVWVPCTIYLFATGAPVRALILLLYGGLVISVTDNVLRPLVIGERTRLPTLFLFFGILGGVEAYGVLGLFLGPVVLAIVVAFAQIYKQQYAGPEPRAAIPPVV